MHSRHFALALGASIAWGVPIERRQWGDFGGFFGGGGDFSVSLNEDFGGGFGGDFGGGSNLVADFGSSALDSGSFSFDTGDSFIAPVVEAPPPPALEPVVEVLPPPALEPVVVEVQAPPQEVVVVEAPPVEQLIPPTEPPPPVDLFISPPAEVAPPPVDQVIAEVAPPPVDQVIAEVAPPPVDQVIAEVAPPPVDQFIAADPPPPVDQFIPPPTEVQPAVVADVAPAPAPLGVTDGAQIASADVPSTAPEIAMVAPITPVTDFTAAQANAEVINSVENVDPATIGTTAPETLPADSPVEAIAAALDGHLDTQSSPETLPDLSAPTLPNLSAPNPDPSVFSPEGPEKIGEVGFVENTATEETALKPNLDLVDSEPTFTKGDENTASLPDLSLEAADDSSRLEIASTEARIGTGAQVAIGNLAKDGTLSPVAQNFYDDVSKIPLTEEDERVLLNEDFKPGTESLLSAPALQAIEKLNVPSQYQTQGGGFNFGPAVQGLASTVLNLLRNIGGAATQRRPPPPRQPPPRVRITSTRSPLPPRTITQSPLPPRTITRTLPGGIITRVLVYRPTSVPAQSKTLAASTTATSSKAVAATSKKPLVAVASEKDENKDQVSASKGTAAATSKKTTVTVTPDKVAASKETPVAVAPKEDENNDQAGQEAAVATAPAKPKADQEAADAAAAAKPKADQEAADAAAAAKLKADQEAADAAAAAKLKAEQEAADAAAAAKLKAEQDAAAAAEAAKLKAEQEAAAAAEAARLQAEQEAAAAAEAARLKAEQEAAAAAEAARLQAEQEAAAAAEAARLQAEQDAAAAAEAARLKAEQDAAAALLARPNAAGNPIWNGILCPVDIFSSTYPDSRRESEGTQDCPRGPVDPAFNYVTPNGEVLSGNDLTTTSDNQGGYFLFRKTGGQIPVPVTSLTEY